jgi:hypothetical protein
MTKTTSIPQVTIHNVETGEEIIRDANAEELAQIETDKAAQAVAKAESDAKAAQRQLLLDRLGITKEEAQLLLGGN